MTVQIPKAILVVGGVILAIGIGVAGTLLVTGDDDGAGDGSEASSAPDETPTADEAADPSRVIALSSDGDRIDRIGQFVAQGGDPSGARAAFGEPSATSDEGDSCEVVWGPIGLSILFADFGSSKSSPCDSGSAQAADVGSQEGLEEGWSTDQGLTLGSTEEELRLLYPNATAPSFANPAPKYPGEELVLASMYTPYGEGGDTPTLTGVVENGEVTAFTMYIGGAGE